MGTIKEGRVFIDRRSAGFEVGKLLEDKYKDRNVLVLGIPRGGVVVAYEVAKVLNGELSVVITKNYRIRFMKNLQSELLQKMDLCFSHLPLKI